MPDLCVTRQFRTVESVVLEFTALLVQPQYWKCQGLQAEHMNMRIIECIDCSVLMEEGLAYRLIVVLCPLGAG